MLRINVETHEEMRAVDLAWAAYNAITRAENREEDTSEYKGILVSMDPDHRVDVECERIVHTSGRNTYHLYVTESEEYANDNQMELEL
jgi:hypothetical protein